MPRPKVPQEQRIRVTQACGYCKSKKLKCNGRQPCGNCQRRGVECHFAASTRRVRDKQDSLPPPPPSQTTTTQDHILDGGQTLSSLTSFSTVQFPSLAAADQPDARPPRERDNPSSTSTPEGGQSRKLFFGESCSLSYLSTMRTLVKNIAGLETTPPIEPDANSPDHQFSTVSSSRTYQLPLKEATLFLVDCFFNHTQGTLSLFDRSTFLGKVEWTYRHPLLAESNWLCKLNLVLAIGLQLCPRIAPASATKLEQLGVGEPQCAELFFANAKHFRDLMSEIEEGDCTLVEAIILATLYLITVGKRNTGYIYHGMAVHLSYAIDLHKTQQNASRYNEAEISSREILWRNLYIMDRHISAFSGRPPSIQESHCSDQLISSPSFENESIVVMGSHEQDVLAVSVQSAKLLGAILEKVYHQRDFSTQAAINMAVHLDSWVQSLPPSLQMWNSDLFHADSCPSTAQLNIWLFHFYSVTQLTRPFLVAHIKKLHARNDFQSSKALGVGHQNSVDVKKLAEACVRSANRTIKTIQASRAKGLISERNSFIVSMTFLAALVVFTNSFFKILDDGETCKLAEEAIAWQTACADGGYHARLYLHTLISLRDTLTAAKRSNDDLQHSRLSVIERLVSTPQPSKTPTEGDLPIGGGIGGGPLMDNLFGQMEDLSFSLANGVVGLGSYNDWAPGDPIAEHLWQSI